MLSRRTLPTLLCVVAVGITGACGGVEPNVSSASAAEESDAAADEGSDRRKARNEPGIERDTQPGQLRLPPVETVVCPAPTVTVASTIELKAALVGASPGQVIQLADGTYEGRFTATVPGRPEAPIYLCGGSGAVLDGGGTSKEYVVHLDRASHWNLVGFAVRNGQKGVMADGVTGVVIQELSVSEIGDEAIHLRRNSTDNLVIGNEISATGKRRDKFGEGIYVGSAVSNWCPITDCLPDRSDRNVIARNTIANTTSESIDIKEGTTGGLVVDNVFDGVGLVAADSWVDVKGTAWTIRGNRGTNAPLDGFQTHQIVDRWGERNLFEKNTIAGVSRVDDDGDPGYGIALRPVAGNVVRCDNTASGGIGLANVMCH